MNPKPFVTTLIVVGLAALLVISLPGQGPLNPGGGPEPTMKSLDQVEPRTDLATVPGDATATHVITEPGSYFLARNLDVKTLNGIDVRASSVTLDLMGFTILRSAGGAAAGTAIILSGDPMNNIAIRNGHITSGVTYGAGPGDQFTGPGFQYGIRPPSTDHRPTGVRVSGLHVSGCDLDGINISLTDPSNVVEYCSVEVVGGKGISAGQVHHSTARTCGGIAIQSGSTVSFCEGFSVGASGISALADVVNSRARSWTHTALSSSSNVRNCWARGDGGHGIDANYNVSDSYAVASQGHGIRSGGNVFNSYGGGERDGIHALNGNVSNSFGSSGGGTVEDDGIFAARNVSNSYGRTFSGDDGIDAGGNVSNSYGETSSDHSDADGIFASGNITNCFGISAGDDGIDSARNVTNSYGQSSGDDGIESSGSVSNSYGLTTGTGTEAHGIFASYNAANCYGSSQGGDGLYARFTTSYSRGNSAGSGVGLRSFIAVGCTSTGGEAITHKYLMP